MTKLFGNMTNQGLEETSDRLGGFMPFETDGHDMKIDVAYAGKSSGGAQFVRVEGDIGGRKYSETIYYTNRAGENFFLNPQDRTKKVPLPGFTIIDELCMVTTEAPLSEQETEDKIVNVYDPEQKKEVPTSVPVLVGLTGKMVTLGIGQNLENKSVKNDSTGKYEPTADTRVTNNIEKVFHYETKLTVPEARQGKTQGEFFAQWVERNKGQQRDRREIKDGNAGQAGRPGGAPAAGSAAPKTSLFGAKPA
jgi:hypothetical protein